MRIRPFWLVLVLLLVPTPARADDHKADLFGGGTFGRGSSLWGVHAAGAVTLPVLHGRVGRNLSLVGDFSAHFGSPDEEDAISFLGGLRWHLVYGEPKDGEPKAVPFVHALVGGVHTSDGGGSGTDPALAIGAGFDYLVDRRERGGGWGFRGQVDYLIRGDEATDLVRVSGGVVVRFDR